MRHSLKSKKHDTYRVLSDFETCNNYFDGEAAAENLYHPDESDSDDEDDDLTPFERMAKKMEDICPFKDGGVMKKILKQGSGPVVPVDSVVRVHYSGIFYVHCNE